MSATFGGAAIFGVAVRSTMTPAGQDVQKSTYFGADGVFSVVGGTRGRTFAVAGLLWGSTLADLNTARNTLLSYGDGIARTYVDTWGVTWQQVVFNGALQAEQVINAGLGRGYFLPYQLTLEGRI